MLILFFLPAETIAAPPTQSSVAGPSAPQLTPILRKEKRNIQVGDTFDSDPSSVRRRKRQLEKQKKASETQSIVQKIQNTEGCSTEIPISNTTFIGVASLEIQMKDAVARAVDLAQFFICHLVVIFMLFS